MDNVLELLNKLNITYEIIYHEPVYTVNDANKIFNMLDGFGCKNLFLKNKEHYYLYILPDDKMANLKNLTTDLRIKGVHFASEKELYDIMKLTRGCVSPLGLINDEKNDVLVIIDQDIIGKKILVHPNINTSTISINYDDLIKFINYCKNDILFI